MTRSGGDVVVVGLIHDNVSLNPMDFFARGINIHGSYMYTSQMSEAVKLVENKRLNLDKIVTSVVPFEESPKAFETLADPNNREIKVIVEMPDVRA